MVGWVPGVLALMGAAQLPGATDSQQVAPPPHWADALKQPVDWLMWGADLRLRNDSSHNPSLTVADPPGHEVSFERLRLRTWSSVRPLDGLELAARVAWEGRHYWSPSSTDPWDRSEVIVDNVHARIAVPGVPVTLIVGRQDVVFGEGWLVFDGTPLDGPRTAFFDAARVTVGLEAVKGALDLVYVDQRSDPTARLPPLLCRRKPLMEQNERGAIAHLGTRALDATAVAVYGIYKRDDPVLPAGDRGEVYTVGGAVDRELGADDSVRLEGAYQFGHRANAVLLAGKDSRLSAWGTNGRFTHAFQDALANRAWLGFEVLSGNDGGSVANHQFDPLWGRWARYSELFPNELDRPGDRANVVRLNVGDELGPLAGMQVQVNYHAIFAYANRKGGTPGYSDGGRFKGHLFTALVKHSFDRFWTAKLLLEVFAPGDHYDVPPGGGPLASRRDPASFARVEIYGTF